MLIDKDGQAYIYWSMGNIFVARLKENMLELDGEPQIIDNLPEKGLKEGPWVFERNSIYYLTFPHVENKIERLEYAISDNPMGPFKMTGVIMDESPLNCWTNHQSFIEKDGQWFLFYHQNEYSPKFDKNRSACIDSMFFNADGTIRKVTPTYRGVGITNAESKIEIDRFSLKSDSSVAIAFIDTSSVFNGWKTVLNKKDDWIQYNSVEFGKKLKTVQVYCKSEKGGTLEIYLDKADGELLSKVTIPKSFDWQITEAKISNIKPGNHNLVTVLKDNYPVEIDWIRFEK